MNVEVTVRRITPGTVPHTPHDGAYGPRIVPLHHAFGDGFEDHVIPPTEGPGWDYMRVGFAGFGPILDSEWFAGRLTLQRADSSHITPGPRPCMVFSGVWDTPMYTLFVSPYHGVWAVGLRPNL